MTVRSAKSYPESPQTDGAEAPIGLWSNKSARSTRVGALLHVLALELPQLSKKDGMF